MLRYVEWWTDADISEKSYFLNLVFHKQMVFECFQFPYFFINELHISLNQSIMHKKFNKILYFFIFAPCILDMEISLLKSNWCTLCNYINIKIVCNVIFTYFNVDIITKSASFGF